MTEPDVHISGNTAWIACVNKGSITDASGTTNRKWSESAFLGKRAGNWKIIFTHSTRVAMASKKNHDTNDLKALKTGAFSDADSTRRIHRIRTGTSHLLRLSSVGWVLAVPQSAQRL